MATLENLSGEEHQSGVAEMGILPSGIKQLVFSVQKSVADMNVYVYFHTEATLIQAFLRHPNTLFSLLTIHLIQAYNIFPQLASHMLVCHALAEEFDPLTAA